MTHRQRISRLLALLGVILTVQLLAAGPAAAHAELVESSPSNGQRLESPPAEVTLVFTESIGLIEGGLVLLDSDGDKVATPEPVADGATIRWPMPEDLPDDAYLVSWRVASGDSHPVGGAFSFGIGVTPTAVEAGADAAEVPWPVTTTRLAGYLGYSLVAGVLAIAILCWPPARDDRRLQMVLRTGFVLAALSTLLSLLLHGPYTAGRPLTQLFDRGLLADTSHTPFGAWTQLRFFVYLAMAAILWPAASLGSRLNRWLAGAGLAAAAVTFSGTGHAAASGALTDRAIDSVHMLTGGVWLGGLIVLVVAATATRSRPSQEAFAAFSRLALLLVVTLVATGTVNGLLRLDAIDQLWSSTYGLLLSAKVALVAVALAGAAVSRRLLARGTPPWRSVRFEAVATVAVLAVTAVLASTPPPTSAASAATGTLGVQTATVEMDLGDERTALLHVDNPDVTGSSLHVELLDADGELLEMKTVDLQATLPERDLGPLDIELEETADGWVGDFAFPFSGTWTMTLSIEDRDRVGTVTTGELEVQ